MKTGLSISKIMFILIFCSWNFNSLRFFNIKNFAQNEKSALKIELFKPNLKKNILATEGFLFNWNKSCVFIDIDLFVCLNMLPSIIIVIGNLKKTVYTSLYAKS